MIILTLLATLGTAHAQTPAHFHFTEQPGPHTVGLKVVEQYDYSRIWLRATDDLGRPNTGERARPLQTLIWYPAKKSDTPPMTVADYGALAASETNFDHPDLSPDWKKWIDAMTPSLHDTMGAIRDAAVEPGHFPIVIYAPSFSAMAWENADLCEYLASYGYVVIASPDMGATTRGMTPDVAGIEAQARDISFLIGYAQTLPDTDPSAIAVGGFSWGGISNLFAAARDPRIDALFALDGSMRYYPNLVKQSGYVHPEEMTIPLLFFTQGEITIEDLEHFPTDEKNKGANVLNAWTHGDLITVHDLALTHVEHSSMYQRNEDIWKGYAASQKGDYAREDGIPGYAWVARYSLNFLNAYLKHEPAALAFLKNLRWRNGAPPHLFTASFRAAKGTPVTVEAFRAELGKQGFDHAADLYAAMKKEKPDFKLDEEATNDWANNLMAANHFPESIAIAKLNLQINPDSSNAYTILGEDYTHTGDKQLALDSLHKALDKDPNNDEAKAKLKEIESPQ